MQKKKFQTAAEPNHNDETPKTVAESSESEVFAQAPELWANRRYPLDVSLNVFSCTRGETGMSFAPRTLASQ
jgi:hypothetical protein